MKTKYFLTLISALSLGLILSSCSGCKKDDSANNVTFPKEETKQLQTPAQEVQTPQPEETAVVEQSVPTEQTVPENETANVQAIVKPPINENTITEGRAFPSLEFTSYSGKQVSLAKLKGKVVLIDFWAAWCGPCVRAMPDVIETYKEYHDKGFEIIGISLDRDKSQFENYIKENNITWQQYYDGLWWQNKIARRFNVTAIPRTVIVDKNGAVDFDSRNKMPLSGPQLKSLIEQLCSDSAN